MTIDTAKLIGEIKSATSIILGKEASKTDGSEEHLAAKISSQADNMATHIKNSRITKETRDFLEESLRKNINNYVKAFTGLDTLTASKLTYAIAFVVFRTITAATGFEMKA
jgi:hypothetical protein